jgi:hypothetical protein
MSDEGTGQEVSLGPQIGSQERVGLSKSVEDSSHEVLLSLGGSLGLREAVLNTGVMEQLLGDGCSHNAGSSGGRDKSASD